MIRTLYPFFFILLLTSSIQAKPLAPEQIPEPLKPWVDWVLKDNPERTCPFMYNSFEQKRCSWPTQLNLVLQKTSGTFSETWQVYQDSWLQLPGDSRYWPQQVTVNNKPGLVMARNSFPAVQLSAGRYEIKGQFLWDNIPDNLSVPADTGLIAMSVNGVAVPMPAVKDGQLWLKASDVGLVKPENLQNNLVVQVFRKVIDDVPLQVLTHIDLDVSGEQRETKLALPLLPDFLPLQLKSPLPARLEPDGQLLLQLRPGHWQIELIARANHELAAINLPNSDSPDWPKSEIWVFEARPDLRMVEIGQLTAIDPSQTTLPEQWKTLPAYTINQSEALAFKLIRRGDPEPAPSQLQLTRKLWLDFDGAGYTINDVITGKMTSGWRLNTLQPMQLGKASLDNNSQLITLDQDNQQGVEVRKGLLNLNADSRIQDSISQISATGWNQTFQQVNAELNLPPGWRLLAASGVDNVPDSWVSRWSLLDIFLVLIISISVGRLWSIASGIFALVTLVLIWHEADAPHFIWLHILAATALLTVVKDGKPYKLLLAYRNAFWLALVVTAIPFMVSQIRIGLYPQLERPWQSIMTQYPDSMASGDMLSIQANEQALPAAAPAPMTEEMMVRKSALPKRGSMKYSTSASADFERTDPSAKVQTGPGLPQWQWHTVQLSWNSSVAPDQQLRLWYLPPTVTMLLNFIRVGLLAGLALILFGLLKIVKLSTSLPMLLCMALIPAITLTPQKAYADFPSQEMLDNLKARLMTAPDCVPDCAQIPSIHIAVNEKEITLSMPVHAQQAVAIPLPAATAQWLPNQVLVDGTSASGLYRDENGLWLNVSAGEHQVQLKGSVALLDKFNLPLPLQPHRVTVDSSVWQVLGVHEDAQADGQLQFNRIQQAQAAQSKSSFRPSELAPFVTVTRVLMLDLDWRVTTTVAGIYPFEPATDAAAAITPTQDTAIMLEVPLLPGESVTTEGIRVKDGKVAVAMTGAYGVFEWQSTLEKSDKIELQAAPTQQWTEVWRAEVSPVWHVESSGIAVMHQDNDQQWLPEWHPWSGEKVLLQISRPKAVEGQTLTIDQSLLVVKPGQRAQDIDLKLSVRSSQDSQYTITLPEQAVLQAVTINGESRAIRQEGQKVTLPIIPGKQDIAVSWQQNTGIASVISTPMVDLGLASVNTNLSMALGQDRWVLFTHGPKFGAAVLFWGVLVVTALLSVGLGKIQLTPLKHWQWFLLLVGLSQIPLEFAGIVIAWLLLLGWRAKQITEASRFFNGLQLSLAGLSALALGLLFYAVAQGLLDAPSMQVIGNQSSAFNLNWYQDRSPAILPTATVISLPVMAYRLLMLSWSLWLAMSLLNWLKWGWQCYSTNGLWHKKPPKIKAEPEK